MPRSRKTTEKDVIGKLQDAGEDALKRLTDLPGGKALLKTTSDLRDRLDEMAKRLRAVDPLERRVSALEKRLTALEPAKSTSKPKTKTTSRARTTRKKTTPRKTTTRSSGGNAKT
jgi:hypothetical protein